MPGGKGKINEFNNSLTPEQKREHARKAGSAPKKKKQIYTIKQLAKIINESPAQNGAKSGLEKLGLKDEQMTNAALIVASVFRAAFEGDMKAVDKWEKYIGQSEKNQEDNGILADLIDGLKEDDNKQ